MEHDMYNKQLMGVCSIICKQTITVIYVVWYVNKQLLGVNYWSMICKQTITGCM